MFKDLEELATKAYQSEDNDIDEDDSYIPVPTNLLAPSLTFSFSFLIDLNVLTSQSTKAIKKCGHFVQTLTFNTICLLSVL